MDKLFLILLTSISVSYGLKAQKKPDAIVYFTADWCAPCKVYGPDLKKEAKKAKVPIIIRDVSERSAYMRDDLIRKHNIKYLPATLYFYGSEIKLIQGAENKVTIRTRLGVN